MIDVFILFLVVTAGILNLYATRFVTREREVRVFVFISALFSLILASVLLCFKLFGISRF
ncbi:hypothetical protein EIP73_11165 [Xylella fastidiosa subsp. pauca]|nr:hypothetical protein EIP73_11080 [Xylella fastidiosa subsp. pauca]TNW23347.1 hypothetical protein EIP73_11165 [Xylella fastidiosa subsp. pauca]TNW25382.1 hypothetical protein EIP74_02495 [Xylella fastidiosa subsp. pauca]